MSENNSKPWFGAIAILIFYMAIFFLYVSGIIHSYKRHSKIDFVLSFTPWGIYRGAESFWHKSDKTPPLTERQQGVNVLRILTAMPETAEQQAEIDKAAMKFADIIKEESDERKAYLQAAANMYIRFHSTMVQEMKAVIKSIIDSSGNLSIYRWDKGCKQVMDSLIVMYGEEEMTKEYDTLGDDLVKIRNGVAQDGISDSDKLKLLDELDETDRKDKIRIGGIYRKLFGFSPPVEGY